MKTAIALSGGVDSAVAAYKLKQSGHDLVGVFMRFWHEPADLSCANCTENKCCSKDSLIKIKKICLQLEIPLLIYNFEKEFKKAIVDKFIKYYQSGQTPNPCVWCNEEIKFKLLLKETKRHGIDQIATGHYARIEKEDNHYYLKRGRDKTKDQSYFLYRLNQSILKKTIFPLGGTTKKNNQKIAGKIFSQLKFDQQPESQDLCFFPEDSYKPFILRHSQKLNQPGNIINPDGEVIGQHDGLINYTVGQRKGIKIGGGPVWYVKKINPKKNELIVADWKKILCDKITINQLITTPKLKRILPYVDKPNREVTAGSLTAQIRSSHQPAVCVICKDTTNHVPTKSAHLIINFHQPQFAPTPGQHCVIYQNDLIIGGGEIS